MDKYPILQSGFISMSDKGLSKPDALGATIRDSILMKEHHKNFNKYFYSSAVTALYNRWDGNTSIMRDFDFREKVIKTTFEAFNVQSIYKWMMFQNKKDTVGNLHKVFLNETLEFILANKPRNIQTVQWTSLLEANKMTLSTTIDVDKYFDAEANRGIVLPSTLSDFVNRWLMCPNGFEDMLVSLFVIFGNKELRSDVADLTVNSD